MGRRGKLIKRGISVKLEIRMIAHCMQSKGEEKHLAIGLFIDLVRRKDKLSQFL